MSAIPKDVGIKDSHSATTSGFEKPSREKFNTNHGRVASSPTSGSPDGRGKTPRGRAAGAPDAMTAATPYLV